MKTIQNQVFDQERALYGMNDVRVEDCSFDGPADGESPFKEGKNLEIERCFFNLRYPFWHDHHLVIRNSEMTQLCRAAIWYSHDIEISDTKLHGIKALRECHEVKMQNCNIVSPEFGWFVDGIRMENSEVESEYFMLKSKKLDFKNVNLDGKYAFQYVENSTFDHCCFNTKDALWHAKNVHVRNSVLKGEYLAWYCENVTFENCTIIGTQPLCYCKGLRLIDCKMEETDLAFEKSDVQATLTTPVVSIKNPRSGYIEVPSVETILMDDPDAQGKVILKSAQADSSSLHAM
ncbi:DUF3737 family protein [uncultured Ruthenibacterium sp.]|uniref:DUF3737 family protein n=1 Tax=uncultured Ruthenibacterium sp. TaxID=1905347 RepID=UPI00349EC92E